MTTDNIVMLEIRLSIVDWVYSKTQILLVALRTQNRPRWESCALSEVEQFVSINWMCKKHMSVSHSSTESEIISLDAGLRMDGLLALDLCDVVIEMLRSSNSTKPPTRQAAGNCSQNHKQKTTNASSSQGESQLCIFEDNEQRSK